MTDENAELKEQVVALKRMCEMYNEDIKKVEANLYHYQIESSNYLIKLRSTEHRLSHLMDVAGKMAAGIRWSIKAGDFDRIAWEDKDQVKFDDLVIALAEWDGIKEGGK